MQRFALCFAVTVASFLSAAVHAGDDHRRIGQLDAPERTPGTLRLATYNALNLFDDHDNPALTGRNDDADDTKPASEKQALADAIRAIDADVIAMQEIGRASCRERV